MNWTGYSSWYDFFVTLIQILFSFFVGYKLGKSNGVKNEIYK
jgi:hypothetical protein